jgi:hypothetical protein
MADYSMSPLDLLVANQQKGYVGLRIEQGVPLLDRDLNLLHDLISATVRSVVTRYIGNGIAAGADGFAIAALPAGQNSQNFRISAAAGGTPGSCLVGGIEVTIAADTAYGAQVGAVSLTTPTAAQPDPRKDIAYLDVFLIEVDGTVDVDLTNSVDVGMQTSVRLKPSWAVRVAEGVAVPAAPAGHIYYPLAQLLRPRGNAVIETKMITDLRQSRLTVSDMEQRLSLMERLLLQPAFTTPPLPQFLPKSGPINQNITLVGTNFNVGTVQVRFGAIAASIVGAPSATQIVVRVPPGLTPAGTPVGVKITVSNPGGSDISDDTFTALAAPAFAEAGGQFTPNHGLPGQSITINGFNFNAANAQVTIGGLAATLVGTPTANQIVAQIPAGLVPGGSTSADVKVIVTTGTGMVTSDDTLRAEINIPAPAFVTPPTAQFLPKSGPGGQTITLNGQNFNFAPATVKFDTTAAIVSGVPSATQIAVVVPAGMITGGAPPKGVKITVTTPGGSVISADTFTVTGP